jgi:hypothetical protein
MIARGYTAQPKLDKALHGLTPVTRKSLARNYGDPGGDCGGGRHPLYFLQPFKFRPARATDFKWDPQSSSRNGAKHLRQIGEFIVLGRNYQRCLSRG